jgi:hypothetical protein
VEEGFPTSICAAERLKHNDRHVSQLEEWSGFSELPKVTSEACQATELLPGHSANFCMLTAHGGPGIYYQSYFFSDLVTVKDERRQIQIKASHTVYADLLVRSRAHVRG